MKNKSSYSFLAGFVSALLILSIAIVFFKHGSIKEHDSPETGIPNAAPAYDADADTLNLFLLGRIDNGDTSEHRINGSILCIIDSKTNAIALTYYPSDTTISKGGIYQTHVYGGSITLDSLYRMGYTWNGTQGAKEVMKQAVYNNFGIKIDFCLEIAADDFQKLFEQFDDYALISTIM